MPLPASRSAGHVQGIEDPLDHRLRILLLYRVAAVHDNLLRARAEYEPALLVCDLASKRSSLWVSGSNPINGDWLPDLTSRSPEDIRRCLDEHDAYTEKRPGVVTRNANEVFAFANEISVGDLVVLPRRPQADRFAAGIVTAPYTFRTNWLSDVVDVDWGPR
jgi:hypothetical protein